MATFLLRYLHPSRNLTVGLLGVSRHGAANKDRRFTGALLIKDEQSGDLPRQDTASCPWRDCRESPVSDAGPPTPSLAIPLQEARNEIALYTDGRFSVAQCAICRPAKWLDALTSSFR
jgi:hypothetical protein